MSDGATLSTGHLEATSLPIFSKPTIGYRLVRLVGRPLLFHFLFRVRVSGREHLPKGPYIAAANHLSGYDAPLATVALPLRPRLHILGDPRAIMPHRVRWWIVKRVGGLIPVDRDIHGDQAVRQRVVAALDLGCAALIFPEATCGPQEGSLLPFKKGFAHFAAQSGVPIIPVAITGTRSAWFLKRITINIGAPIVPVGRDIDDLVDMTRHAIEGLFVPDVVRRGPRLLAGQLASKRSPADLA